MPTALTPTETVTTTTPRPIVNTPQPRNGGKWWEVALDNGRRYAFETQAQAKKFIRENRT